MIGIDRNGPSGTAVVVLIVIAGIIVALQYTAYAVFAAEQTSLLWGVLVGLIIGGFLFGWLRFRDETPE